MTTSCCWKTSPKRWRGLKIHLEVYPTPYSTMRRASTALSRSSQDHIDVALIDLGLPYGSGVDVVAALREAQPKARRFVVTIQDATPSLPGARPGAFGYLLKDRLARSWRSVPPHEPG